MTITIVGLGVVGGSIAQALHQAGYAPIYGVDTNPATLAQATEEGTIQAGYPDARPVLAETDLLIIALYPQGTVDFVRENLDWIRPETLMMDVNGVKHTIIPQIESLLPEGYDFVYTHPMAGRESRGYAYADGKVFEGANFLIIPTDRNTEAHLQQVEQLARDMKFGRISRISADFHDQMISFTSQLPHTIAVALMNSDHEERQTGRFTGDSYPELTRIAKINEDLWSELFLENADYLLASMDDFQRQFDQVKAAIRQGDADQLKALFRHARQRREALEAELDERKRSADDENS